MPRAFSLAQFSQAQLLLVQLLLVLAWLVAVVVTLLLLVPAVPFALVELAVPTTRYFVVVELWVVGLPQVVWVVPQAVEPLLMVVLLEQE